METEIKLFANVIPNSAIVMQNYNVFEFSNLSWDVGGRHDNIDS